MLTDLGTPRAHAWSLEWFERVEALEHELGRRVCGGVCADGNPCRRASKHSSGRCTHHGGNHLTGAPEGNENARIHGLYSRRLQRCGPQCAQWDACPFAEDDLIEIPLKIRPNCVYEQTEYDALIAHYQDQRQPEAGPYRMHRNADGSIRLVSTEDEPGPPPPDVHLIHQVALLQVMVSRAAAALSLDGFTETTRATGADYAMESSKMSAALQAFLRLAREHRQYRRELMHETAATKDATANQQPQSLSARVMPLLKKAEGVLEEELDFEKRRLAKHGPVIQLIENENERFYETHGHYPALEEWERDEDEEEEGNSDKDEHDGQDVPTGSEGATRKQERQGDGLDTDSTDRADASAEADLVRETPSATGLHEDQGPPDTIKVPP